MDLKIKLTTKGRLYNHKVLSISKIMQQKKIFLITYNNTYKLPYINNYSFLIGSVAKRLKFSTVTQVSMNSFKTNNFRHISTSVCRKANHSNNHQAWPFGKINLIFSVDNVDKSIHFGYKLLLDQSDFLDVSDFLLKHHYNTKFQSHIYLFYNTSGLIDHGIFYQENFNFTCDIHGLKGLRELVLFIKDSLEKKKPDITPDYTDNIIVVSLWRDNNDSWSGSGSSSGSSLEESQLKNNNLYMVDAEHAEHRQSISIPKHKIINFSVLAWAKCPSNFRDTYLNSYCESSFLSSFLSLYRSLINNLFASYNTYNLYNSNNFKFRPIKYKQFKFKQIYIYIPRNDINAQNITRKLNKFMDPYTRYYGNIKIKGARIGNFGKTIQDWRFGDCGPLDVRNIVHRIIILYGHNNNNKNINIYLYLWFDPIRQVPNTNRRYIDTYGVQARSVSTSKNKTSLKVNEGKKIEIVRADYSNPGKPIVNIIYETDGSKLYHHYGFNANIKTQMFIKRLWPDKWWNDNDKKKRRYVDYIFNFNAIDNIPKPNLFVYVASKSELSVSKHITNIYNSSTDMLNVFNARLKKDKIREVKSEYNNYNYIGKPRHYPPANKEWFNSIYVYNNNTVKLLPTLDKVTLKLVKSYFNFYSRKLEKKIKSRRLRIRGRRLSTNRILISRAELKHTNDKVIVTIYVYNRQKKYYFNKIFNIVKIKNFLPNRRRLNIIKKKSLKIKSKVNKQKKIVWKTLDLLFSSFNNKAKANNKFKNYETSYLKHYVTRSLRKEILSIYLWQLISFNERKFEKTYLLPLTSLVTRVYNKQVEFNLVNLKYLYLNSYIFSETLVTKIKNRKNRLLRVLRTSLLMLKLPFIDRAALYEQIYNRKRKLQNLKVDHGTDNAISLRSNIKSQFNDLLERSLLNMDPKDSISKLKDFKSSEPQSLAYRSYPLFILNTILRSIRNKSVSGIRLEVAGRLTKRNRADRSLFKLRYKGNIKNMDSSFKGLSAVLLRGYAKSNLQYTKVKSTIRIGSYGLKGSVSSS